MIEWILGHLGVVVFLVIFLSQIVRAIMRAQKAKAEHESQHDESAEARRMREVQEDIRRQIEQRRRGEAPAQPTLAPSREFEERPVPRPQTTQMPEPFGGPLGRMLEELQKRTQPPPPAPPPPVLARNTAELQRQEQLAEEMRVLEETRMLAKRRAATATAAKKAEANSQSGQLSSARRHLLEDVKDKQSLRRAFVLREVLGPPVSLR